ncbi:MAG: helix-hairpin-helix domain-containing protein [Thermoanaerobaculia bacterium]
MAVVSRSAIARILRETAALLELKGENPFRARAYSNGARAIEGLTEDPTARYEAGTLAEIQGIGPGLVASVAEILLTGKLSLHDELNRHFPAGTRALLKIPGLGVKRLRTLIAELGIDSPAALERACRDGRVAALSGFGAKSQEKILEGLAAVSRFAGRHLLPVGVELAEIALQRLRQDPAVRRAEATGEVRRRLETIAGIALLVAVPADERAAVVERFVGDGSFVDLSATTADGLDGTLEGDVGFELRFVDSPAFAARWLTSTGSAGHLAELEAAAQEQGPVLDDGGVRRAVGAVPGSEAAVYAGLGLPWIEPELREGLGEVAALRGAASPELVSLDDLRGTFHVHSTWSDGIASIAEMAGAAAAHGWEYLGIADHSRAAAYAGGLDADRVRRQWQEIDAWNAAGNSPRLFKGTECDILTDGALDFDDELLSGFDFVVVSIHSQFQLSREAMTARLVRAVSHPSVTFLGHATGRLLLVRDPYEVDLDAVLEAAAANGVIVELNANPHRLDLDWRVLRRQLASGRTTSIHPDAHSPQGLADVRWGIDMARKAGASKSQILNTRTVAEIAGYFEQRRRRAAALRGG